MYNYVLNINIYSECLEIENELLKIQEFERFTHQIKTYPTLVKDSIVASDIIILDIPYARNNLELIQCFKNKDTLLVVALFPDQISSLCSDDYKIIHDIWMKSLSPESIQFYFQKIQKFIKLERDYQQVQNYLDTLIDTIPDLIWFKDIKGAHLKVNNSFCYTVGKTKKEVEGRGHYYIWDLEIEEYEKGEYVCLETDEHVIKEKKTCLFNEKVKCQEEMRQFKTYKSPIFDSNNNVIGTVGVAHDVTDLWNIHAEMEVVLENMPFAILVHDNKGNILSINKSFTDMFDIQRKNIIGKNYYKWKMSILNDITKNNNENSYQSKVFVNGQEKILEISNKPLLDIFEKVSGTLLLYNDITRKQKQQEKIIVKANTDYLTGVYNRRYLYEYLNENRDFHHVCLFYIDLDNFKYINDTFGHKEGDNALIYFAKILNQVFPDHKIFRIGGDEFIVTILDNINVDEIINYANTLLKCIHKQLNSYDNYRLITASIGIVIDNNSIDLEELIKRGDYALYEAKLRGKNQFCMWNELNM